MWCQTKIAFLLMKLVHVRRIWETLRRMEWREEMRMVGINETERGARNNNNVRSCEPSVTICRLLGRVCWPSRTVILQAIGGRENGSEKRDEKRRFYLANFINFAISWQWSSNDFRTPRAKRLFSCLCASAGFIREIAEHVYNVARISRMLPRHPGEHSGLDLYDTKLETRHSDDTFHTRHVKILFLSGTLPLKCLVFLI